MVQEIIEKMHKDKLKCDMLGIEETMSREALYALNSTLTEAELNDFIARINEKFKTFGIEYIQKIESFDNFLMKDNLRKTNDRVPHNRSAFGKECYIVDLMVIADSLASVSYLESKNRYMTTGNSNRLRVIYDEDGIQDCVLNMKMTFSNANSNVLVEREVIGINEVDKVLIELRDATQQLVKVANSRLALKKECDKAGITKSVMKKVKL